jgi:SAM-dependent methyltransferase
MDNDYRRELFAAYHEHAGRLDPDDGQRLAWFRAYYSINYRAHLARLDPARAHVLELGCNKGYLLQALRAAGFRHLTGVDLSTVDLERARSFVPDADLVVAEASDYLERTAGRYDLIVLKAILEHQPKDTVLALLGKIRRALLPGGMVLVDVPSMDWLFAGHERYMDFTHEVGFTRESLRQILGLHFESVEVHTADTAPDLKPWRRAARQAARAVLGTLLRIADPEGAMNPIWARAIVAIGRAPAAEASGSETARPAREDA